MQSGKKNNNNKKTSEYESHVNGKCEQCKCDQHQVLTPKFPPIALGKYSMYPNKSLLQKYKGL